ncbi:MAG: DUF3367 domain-containing protein, partial [Acidimicrobiales bacterium]|nr:DUF3367 domain-containing protein [Acidimicrobiales bacterium]
MFVVLATCSTLLNSPGRYIGDSRFEQFFNPARRLAKSLTIWDPSRGLGRVREDFWPGTTLPMAVLRSVGFSPTTTEHLWHALLLSLVGVGMVQMLRLFRPRLGIEHIFAGLSAMFGAYSATFLTPFSNLYFQFAVAPWLIVAFYRGLHSDRPWRWAAAFAVLVFLPGDVDTPGLIYNMVPLAAVAIYVLLVERSVTVQRTLGWLVRAGILTLAVNAAVLVKIYIGAANFGQRLNDTESAEVSFLTSSWPESLRGLGNWLSYYRDEGALLKPQGAAYFNNWLVVVCTFVPPLMALLVMWLSRWRPRILFAGMALGSLVVLVGAYPLNEASPLGNWIYRAFADIPFFMAFRNTYKIGSGLTIGVSALFGYGVAAAYRRVRRLDRHLALLPVGLAAVAILGAGFPFWTGKLYNPTQQFSQIPSYWDQALDWLDTQPGDGRVLILPPTSRARYRWGWVGDDIFDALLARPHATATGVPLSTPYAANLLEVMSFGSADPGYEQGTLAPIMRRLGFRYVLIRNDLDWRSVDRPRPASYKGIRGDKDLRRVATFGRVGENVTDPSDTSKEADQERSLPPVEIYELTQPGPTGVRIVGNQRPLLVSGDGWAYPELAAAGLLDDDGTPVVYTGALANDSIEDELGADTGLVVTDTNRRRLRVMLSYEPDYSHTLAEGQVLDRTPQELFPLAPGSQSVAWFKDATVESVTGPPRTVNGSQPWNRPANAFDGDLNTAFVLKRGEIDGRIFRVSLRRPRPIGKAVINVANVVSINDGIVAGVLRFSDGSEVPVNLAAGEVGGPNPVRTVEVEFPVRTTQWVEFKVTRVAGTAQQFGLAEISFPGLDLEEYLQVPDDVFRRAVDDPGLATRLRESPVVYLFDRWRGNGPVDEESALRRRFPVLGNRPYELTGRLRVRRGVSDQVIDALVARPIGAYGARRYDGDPANAGVYATDGDLATGWTAAARVGETLTVHFPEQVVTRVSLASLSRLGTAITKVDVTVGDRTETVAVEKRKPCPDPPEGDECQVTDVEVPPTRTNQIKIRVAELENPGAGSTGAKVMVGEVRINCLLYTS